MSNYYGPPMGVPRLCLWCKKPHSGAYASGRFCKNRCARAFCSAKNPNHAWNKGKKWCPEIKANMKAAQQKRHAEGRGHLPVPKGSHRDVLTNRKTSLSMKRRWASKTPEERAAWVKAATSASMATGLKIRHEKNTQAA